MRQPDAALISYAAPNSFGPALEDRNPSSSAFPIRGRKLGVLVSARWTDAADDATHRAWVRRCLPALGHGDATYSNYTDGEERVVGGYPKPIVARLEALKAQHDPDNVFRHNHNIGRRDGDRGDGDRLACAAGGSR